MTKVITIFITFIAGSGLAIQAVVNSSLKTLLGSGIAAAVINFVIGLFFLFSILLLQGQIGALQNISSIAWYQLLGGILGALYIFTAASVVKELGVTFFLCAAIAGQLILAVLIDHFGWFGMPISVIDLKKCIGIFLIIISVLLVR